MQDFVGSPLNIHINSNLFEEINERVWDLNILFEGTREGVFLFAKTGITTDLDALGKNIVERLDGIPNDDIQKMLKQPHLRISEDEKYKTASERFHEIINNFND